MVESRSSDMVGQVAFFSSSTISSVVFFLSLTIREIICRVWCLHYAQMEKF